MVKQTSDQPEALMHVRTVRRELDFATLWRWFEVKQRHPNYFKEYDTFVERIRAVNHALTSNSYVRSLGESFLKERIIKLKGGGLQKPLPEQLRGFESARLRQFVPDTDKPSVGVLLDKDAAFGYAVPVYKPGKPFKLYSTNCIVDLPSGEHRTQRVRRHVIKNEDTTPGLCRVHRTEILKIWKP